MIISSLAGSFELPRELKSLVINLDFPPLPATRLRAAKLIEHGMIQYSSSYNFMLNRKISRFIPCFASQSPPLIQIHRCLHQHSDFRQPPPHKHGRFRALPDRHNLSVSHSPGAQKRLYQPPTRLKQYPREHKAGSPIREIPVFRSRHLHGFICIDPTPLYTFRCHPWCFESTGIICCFRQGDGASGAQKACAVKNITYEH